VRFAVSILFLGACARSTPSERVLVSEAQDETRRFFALAEGSDCGELGKLMLKPESCESLVKQFKDTHAHLTQIDEAKLDGRDKQMVLVMVQAQAETTVHHWIVRAKWTSKGWKLAL
jgi:hypothetical protein